MEPLIIIIIILIIIFLIIIIIIIIIILKINLVRHEDHLAGRPERSNAALLGASSKF